MGAFAREASGIWISRQLSVTTLQKNKGVRTEIMIATSMSISTAVAWAGKQKFDYRYHCVSKRIVRLFSEKSTSIAVKYIFQLNSDIASDLFFFFLAF